MRWSFGSNTYRLLFSAAFSSLLLLPLSSCAIEPVDAAVTVATWNVGFIDRNVGDLDIPDFLNEVDFDILLVNEVQQQSDLDALKAAMGREAFFTSISTFVPGSSNPGDLEVGIISRFPLNNIVEFDRSPDNAGDNTERRLERVDQPGIADVGVGRGFLVAEVSELNLFVIVSHFKSSRGQSGPSDFGNAQKRELVAAAVATHALELLEENPGHTVLFGGDVNVGIADSGKNGTDLTDDRNDGYDDTHALLGDGLIGGLRMRSLVQAVDSTFVGNDNIPDFPGTGAIDVLYAVGELAEAFSPAVATSDRFGSDHLAVFASLASTPLSNPEISDPSVTPPAPEDTPSIEIEEEGSLVSISNALPNPEGSDVGRETVTLTYEGTEALDISAWILQDKAGNQFSFAMGTTLVPGDNEFMLQPPTMPLNNDGDTIVLLDSNGVQQGEAFTYSSREVIAGQPIR